MAVHQGIHGTESDTAIVLHYLHLDASHIVVHLSGLVSHHLYVVSERRLRMNAPIDSADLNQLSGRHFASPVEGITPGWSKPRSKNSKYDERCREHLISLLKQQIVSRFSFLV